MPTTKLGSGNGKYIAALCYLGRESQDVKDYKMATVKYKNGDKFSVPLFACNTEEEVIANLKALTKYASTMSDFKKDLKPKKAMKKTTTKREKK